MKKRSLVLGSILLAALSFQTFAKTTVTPFAEVESYTFDNKSDQKQDDVIFGVAVTQSLTDTASLSIEAKTYDYDYIGDNEDSTTSPSSKDRLVIYLNNQVYKNPKGAVANVAVGIQKDTAIVTTTGTSKAISYRVKPTGTLPLTKTLAITGDWLFTKDKTDKVASGTGTIGDYFYTNELLTGIKYTGITNWTLQAQHYNYLKKDLDNPSTSDYKESVNQLRLSASTKVAGITITPNLRFDLGKYQFENSVGKDSTQEYSRKRYGVDLSKSINNVTYGTSLFIEPREFNDSLKDYTYKYAKVSATYTF